MPVIPIRDGSSPTGKGPRTFAVASFSIVGVWCAIATLGCFKEPQYESGTLACDGNRCPPHLTCMTGLCVKSGAAGAGGDAGPPGQGGGGGHGSGAVAGRGEAGAGGATIGSLGG